MEIIINFKNYKTGRKALRLSELIKIYIPRAIVCPTTLDISKISEKTKLKTFAQHVSCFHKGKATGFIIPEFLKKDGASGSLLNHSEHPISLNQIKKTLKETNKSKLKIILCASSLSQIKSFKKMKPWAIAYEDKKLIGTGKSITQYRKKELEKFIQLLKKTKIRKICGAGINSRQDILEAKKIGCDGVLVASAITNVSIRKAKKLLKSWQ